MVWPKSAIRRIIPRIGSWSQVHVVNKYAYDPFGALTASTEAQANPFKYIGQFGVQSEPFDLLFAARRYYQPLLGRFLTKDPAAPSLNNSQALNQYVYSLNNPIILIDPSGLSGQRDGSTRFEPRGPSDQNHTNILSANRASATQVNASLIMSKNNASNFWQKFAFDKLEHVLLVDIPDVVACVKFGIQGAGEIGEAVLGGLEIRKTSKIADDLMNPDYIVGEIDDRYQNSARQQFIIDNMARGTYDKSWPQLTPQEKKDLTNPDTAPAGVTLQMELGGGLGGGSGFYIPIFGREFLIR